MIRRVREWSKALLPVGLFLGSSLVGALILTSYVGLATSASNAHSETQTVRSAAGKRIDGLLCDLANANRDKADLASELADALARNEALSTQLERLGVPLVVTTAPPLPQIVMVGSACPK